jgi:hypothetical protein
MYMVRIFCACASSKCSSFAHHQIYKIKSVLMHMIVFTSFWLKDYNLIFIDIVFRRFWCLLSYPFFFRWHIEKLCSNKSPRGSSRSLFAFYLRVGFLNHSSRVTDSYDYAAHFFDFFLPFLRCAITLLINNTTHSQTEEKKQNIQSF